VTQIPTSECDVLRTLYETTDGANWTSRNGWMRTERLHMVWCDVQRRHVVALNLTNNNLNGRTAEPVGQSARIVNAQFGVERAQRQCALSTGSAANLRRLYLQNNLLIGDLPANLANLDDTLDLADFGYNRFTASESGVIAFLQNTDPIGRKPKPCAN